MRFGPLQGPPSSSCGGLVAYSHQLELLNQALLPSATKKAGTKSVEKQS